jgi:DSF synthase
MYDLGIVHQLAEPGEGIKATRQFISRNSRHHAGLYGAKRAMRESSGVSLDELKRNVEHWADSALQLRQQDLKMMNKLTSAQTRKVQAV